MIIESLLDTDLYKFTMQQVVFHRFPFADVEYTFQCRTAAVDLAPYVDEIRAEIDHFCGLQFTPDEIAFLRSIRYLNPSYVDALQRFQLRCEQVHISTENGFALTVTGNWYQTILFEVPILAIVNEVYFRNTQPNAPERDRTGADRLREKCRLLRENSGPKINLIEFGTRRRYSREWQRTVIDALKVDAGDALIGSSNVLACKDLGLKCYGTMAHEYLQACQVFAPLPEFQRFALETWMQEYRGDLGIALSDVVGMRAFLGDFDKLFCKAYDGARHDSGDPYEWGDSLIEHYRQMGVDPRVKSGVFSDGLDIPKCLDLARYFDGRLHTMFGVGTNLTNDFSFKPLNIVLKMTRCNGRPVAKLSDSPGKTMCKDEIYLAYLRELYGLPPVAATS